MLATVGVTKWAAVDFSETVLNSQAMQIGGYGGDLSQPESETNLHPRTVSSFQSLFNSSRPWLDMNGDGVVWGPVDSELAIDAIMKKVEQDFSPYDLKAFRGDFAAYRWILTDGIVGDGIVLVTGDSSFIPDERGGIQHLFGHSPPADRELRRNDHDEIVFVFGKSIAESAYRDFAPSGNQAVRDAFITGVASTISHELGHTFGLWHNQPSATQSDLERQALVNDMMSAVSLGHDQAFLDIAYLITPSLSPQNSHRHLLRGDILGPSKNSWAAVLRPGELTISGNASSNDIGVWEFGGSISGYSIQIDGRSIIAEHRATSAYSLNLFDQVLTTILVYGNDGADKITIHPSVQITTKLYGGNGADRLYGGSGRDYLYGGEGADYLYGLAGSDYLFGQDGNDWLYGGSEADYLYGGADNDHLYGDAGADYLYGDSGDDFLDGGRDSATDRLFGGSGRDTLVQNYYQWWHYSNVIITPDSPPPQRVMDWVAEDSLYDYQANVDWLYGLYWDDTGRLVMTSLR
ncbi:MAG TPA: hypothetical protein VFV87_19565 [Pirellulaceae bacterium]|nr:hypothetical protein [Pirellulaceae bacterium]